MCETPPKSPSPPLPHLGDPPEFPQNPQIPGNSPQNARNWARLRPRRRCPARTRLRNRRFAALQELLREGVYFSEERMRLRAPALFHHYIGRFQGRKNPKTPQNPPQIPQNPPQIPPNHPQNPKIPRNGPKIHLEIPEIPPREPQDLRELLLRALDESGAQAEQDEEDEDEEDEEDEDEEQIPDPAELELLRQEFTSRMFQRFLEGQERDFDYSQVDENPALEDAEQQQQDVLDDYFDEEEPGPAPPLL